MDDEDVGSGQDVLRHKAACPDRNLVGQAGCCRTTTRPLSKSSRKKPLPVSFIEMEYFYYLELISSKIIQKNVKIPASQH